MTNRRSFFKDISLAAIAIALGASKLNAKNDSFSKSDFDFDNWKSIQKQFTLKKGYNYFNNGTLGPSPKSVQQVVIDSLRAVDKDCNYNGGEIARHKLAEFVNAKTNEISLSHNTTEGINVVAWGLPLKADDEVIISSHEHVGNAMPWINRAQIDHIKIKTFNPEKSAEELLDQIKKLITSKTRVIAIPHISCTIGQLFPIEQIIELAHNKGVYCMIDGAHGPGAFNIDVVKLNVDFYVSCCHKWMLGPKGTGFLFVKEEMQDILKPTYAGAYTDSGFDITKNPPTFNGYNNSAHRYDYGTQNSSLLKGVAAAVDFHQKIGKQKIQERVLALNNRLYQLLKPNKKIELLNSDNSSDRSMMLGFRHSKIDYKEVAQLCGKESFRIRQVPESNINSLRISTHIYNSTEQIDEFAAFVNSL